MERFGIYRGILYCCLNIVGIGQFEKVEIIFVFGERKEEKKIDLAVDGFGDFFQSQRGI